MSGAVQGQVLDERSGEPIAGAGLELIPEGCEQQAGDDGYFVFAEVPAGSDYHLTATNDGYETGIYRPLVVLDGTPLNIVIALQPSDI